MSTETTNAILAALQKQGEALSLLIKNINVKPSNPAGQNAVNHTLMSHSVTFEIYNQDEDFALYRERLENFFRLRQLTADTEEVRAAKQQILLNCIGSSTYKLLSSLCAPKKPNELSYEEIIQSLEKQLCPTVNVFTERHKFLSRIQQKGETITAYIAALKLIAQKCNWECSTCKQQVNAIFTAQFIRGLNDAYIREKILQMEETTDVNKILELALNIEAAKKENTEEYKHGQVVEGCINKVNKPVQAKPYFKSRGDSSDKFKGLCLCCGKNNHKAYECRSKAKLRCTICKRKGHISKVCFKTSNNYKSNIKTIEVDPSDSDIYINKINSSDKIIINVCIENKKQPFELDTGSPVSILSLNDFKNLNLNIKLDAANVTFKAYNNTKIFPLGIANVNVTYKNKTVNVQLYIVKENFSPILGRHWIDKLNILKLESIETPIEQINKVQTVDIKNILQKYENIFSLSAGVIPDVEVTLELKEDTKPVFLKPRTVPFSLLSKVNEELDNLEKQGIIEKTDYCPWGTPLVIVPKVNNNGVRLCADYKVTVNKYLIDSHHPIPRVKELFTKVKKGSYYCVLDISKAYLHIKLDKKSSQIAAISTHKGTYLAKRLFFGLKTAPSLFHKILDPILSSLDGCMAYFDDIFIQGETLEECKNNLIKCLDQLTKFNIHLNKEKCKFFVKHIKYLGYIISDKGLEKDPEKVKAIIATPSPKNVDQVRSFTGLALFYCNFIPKASELLHPITNLLKKDVKFKWTNECEQAFLKIKNELTSDRVLIPYDPDLPLVLECDASPYGLAAVLSNEVNGELKPIHFISRTLTCAEKNYSHLDKEATAIFWATKKLYQYLYGRQFKLVTDNKPLESIFNPQKTLPAITALRLTRYALFLRQFDYSIEHHSAAQHTHVDYLSRAPATHTKQDIVDETYELEKNTINQICTSKAITADIIKKETDKDPTLSKFREEILNKSTNEGIEYSVHQGIVMRGNRVVIPEALQQPILEELHYTHIGVVKMKAIARSLCYWKNIDKDIESLVKSCSNCTEVHKQPNREALHHWEVPQEPWQRVHADYAGPIDGKYFLIVVDAKTKWLEINYQTTAPTSESTIRAFRNIFTSQGIPFNLVTDNANIFKSYEFTNFCAEQGIKQLFSAPYHPATNGLAERLVQTIKQKLKAMSIEKSGNMQEKLQDILFYYRVTPLADGKTPAEHHIGRQLRSKLHMVKPIPNNVKTEQPHVKRQFEVGQRVLSRHYVGNKKWKLGLVVKRLGRVHYLVRLDSNYVIKRHIDQLVYTECNENREVSETTQDCKESDVTKQRHIIATMPDTFPVVTNATTDTLPCVKDETPPSQSEMPTVRRSNRERKPVTRLNL